MAQRDLHCNKVNFHVLMEKKARIFEPQLRGKGGRSGWIIVKHAVKGFAVLIQSLVHGARPASGMRGE